MADAANRLSWLAFLLSRQVTPPVVVATYDMARALRDAGLPVAGGFDAPIERDCLRFLLRGTQPLLVVPARPLERYNPPKAWADAIAQGRLCLHSPFAAEARGNPRGNAKRRNEALADLSSAVLICYASPGGAVESLAHDLLRAGRKPIFTLDLLENSRLIAAGAHPVRPDDLTPLLQLTSFAGRWSKRQEALGEEKWLRC